VCRDVDDAIRQCGQTREPMLKRSWGQRKCKDLNFVHVALAAVDVHASKLLYSARNLVTLLSRPALSMLLVANPTSMKPHRSMYSKSIFTKNGYA
jgi:hypothetical protein